MKPIVKLLFFWILALGMALSCGKQAEQEAALDALEGRIAAIEQAVAASNGNSIAVGRILHDDEILIVGYRELEHGYVLDLSDGSSVTVTFGADAPVVVPILGINAQGQWIVSLDGGDTFQAVTGASAVQIKDGVTPQVRVNAEGYWEVSGDGGDSWNSILNASGNPARAYSQGSVGWSDSFFSAVTFDPEHSQMVFTLLDGRVVKVNVKEDFYLTVTGYTPGAVIRQLETLVYPVQVSNVADAVIQAPDGWTAVLTDEELSVTAPFKGVDGRVYDVNIVIVSAEHYLRNVGLSFTLSVEPAAVKTGIKTWDDFVECNEDNILPDFSYAGFDHGESAPPENLMSLGWTVYDVTDYGAVPNDGLSDREAFLRAYQAAIGQGREQNPEARAILYFPEGEFILHTSGDDEAGQSVPIRILAGYIALKGAGKDKTTLVMQDPNLPVSADLLYSSPVMVEFKHNSSLSELTSVTGDSPKGAFSVTVASSSGIKQGDWVCLSVENNDPAFVAQEVAPYEAASNMTDILTVGVQVMDYHQVAFVKGNVITFKEPLMHAVDAMWGWKVMRYPHYEMVGVEDLSFKGYAKDDFIHHGSWQDDGAYKPLAMGRIANGWVRRVRFTSVSEACSVYSSANVSVYGVEINGNRGHSAIRSQASSRVFIGKVYDHTDGPLHSSHSVVIENAGQFHAVGVSKPSMGTVLWRNAWGKDSCFESHCKQPRATLLDCCEGGWVPHHGGGAETDLPNHLQDLVIWNFNATTPSSGVWSWWAPEPNRCKYLPPIIVGFHGQDCQFNSSQVLVDESHGTAVNPESLYEAQLKKRLGMVPAWLDAIK